MSQILNSSYFSIGIGDSLVIPNEVSKKNEDLLLRIYKCLTVFLFLSPFIAVGSCIIYSYSGLIPFPWTSPYVICSIAVLAISVVTLSLTIMNIKKYISINCAIKNFQENYSNSDGLNSIEGQNQVNPALIVPPLNKELLADVIVCNNAWNSFQLKMEMIKCATTSIEWSFNYAGGADFRDALELIKVRMEQEKALKVHLIISDDFLENKDRRLLESIKKLYSDRFFYLISEKQLEVDPEIHCEDNHIKLLIVDGLYFSIGGNSVLHWAIQNPQKKAPKCKTIKQRCMPAKTFDTDVIGRGCNTSMNIVSSMRMQFYSLYAVLKWRMGHALLEDEEKIFEVITPSNVPAIDEHVNLISNVKTRFLVSSPEHSISPIEAEYIRLIQAAENKIEIATFMLQPTSKIEKTLEESKVKKIVYVDGLRENFVQDIKTSSLKQSCKHFTTVYESSPPNWCYHKKIMIIDKRYAVVGSTNLAAKSLKYDYECICVFDNQEVCKQLKQGLKQDREHMHERSESAWDDLLGATIGPVVSHIF